MVHDDVALLTTILARLDEVSIVTTTELALSLLDRFDDDGIVDHDICEEFLVLFVRTAAAIQHCTHEVGLVVTGCDIYPLSVLLGVLIDERLTVHAEDGLLAEHLRFGSIHEYRRSLVVHHVVRDFVRLVDLLTRPRYRGSDADQEAFVGFELLGTKLYRGIEPHGSYLLLLKERVDVTTRHTRGVEVVAVSSLTERHRETVTIDCGGTG